jgi:pimeloyl-ACP methyl ester carboxylesterase
MSATTAGPTGSPAPGPEQDPAHPGPDPHGRGHLGWILLGAGATAVVTAAVLVAAPFVPATESGVTGGVLIGFALGWGLLALLSMRFTDRPQRWAIAPALVLGGSGLLLILFGEPAHRVLDWVWPLAVLGLAGWIVIAVHRQRSGLLRWSLYPVAVLMLLASIGGGVETVAEAVDAQAHPAPGRLIDVGGHRLHLRCMGAGSPTVVIETGGGDMSSNLGWILPAVARHTRVCGYDRAGRGWSDPTATPTHGIRIATDLHALLARGGVPGPYVLAGHSFGGLYVQTFAHRYPTEVAGMVLIDSTMPKASARGDGAPDLVHRVIALLATTGRMGLLRVVAPLSAGDQPPGWRDEVVANLSRPGTLESNLDEFLDADDSIRAAAALTSFGDKPLVVLTAGSGNDATWTAKQNRLAALSTNSVHRVVPGVVHEDLIASSPGAAATTRGILEVVAALRTTGSRVR